MHVSAILARKGREVFTTAPDASLGAVVAALRRHRVGALVVSPDGVAVAGIVSERDVVRILADGGPAALERPVGDAMTSDVVTCDPHATVEALMGIVTTRRIRHLPVVEDGRLVGLVSIGDLVASRVDELESETEALRSYITSG